MRSIKVERAVFRRRVAIEACRVAVRPSDKVHTIVKPESYGGANGDRKLLQRDQRASTMLAWLASVFHTWCPSRPSLTSQMGRRNLRLIQWNNHTEHPYSNTANNPARKEVRGTLRSRLQASTDRENDDSRKHSILPRNSISQISIEQSAPQAPSSSAATSQP